MKWVTPNRLYFHNPTLEELQSVDLYKFQRIFIIFDADYYSTYKFNCCISDLLDNANNTTKIRLILIRSDYITKTITKDTKRHIRSLFDKQHNVFVETAKNFYIRTKSENSNVFRITSVPNTTCSDYICCGINMFDKSTLLRISGTIGESIVDGIGMRYVVFTQGCPHHCEGCQNPQTWDYKQGTFVSINSLFNDIIQNPMLQGVTFSGGEPFMQPKPLGELIIKLMYHYNKINKHFDYTAFTGFTLEQLKSMCKQVTSRSGSVYSITDTATLLYKCDYIIDGKFDITKKSLNCKFRGSTNQKMYERKRNSIEFKEIFPVQT